MANRSNKSDVKPANSRKSSGSSKPMDSSFGEAVDFDSMEDTTEALFAAGILSNQGNSDSKFFD